MSDITCLQRLEVQAGDYRNMKENFILVLCLEVWKYYLSFLKTDEEKGKIS